MYSHTNPAWGRMMREKEKEVDRSRREAETALAARIRAENPGFTWGEAMRRAALRLDDKAEITGEKGAA